METEQQLIIIRGGTPEEVRDQINALPAMANLRRFGLPNHAVARIEQIAPINALLVYVLAQCSYKRSSKKARPAQLR